MEKKDEMLTNEDIRQVSRFFDKQIIEEDEWANQVDELINGCLVYKITTRGVIDLQINEVDKKINQVR